VLKALALGARAVLVGRPYLWALAVDGEAGVTRLFELLREELRLAMTLAGVTSVERVPRELLAPSAYFAGQVTK
jgi:isopentenyl diphosphate isomerase/L-lactate dehydrogenase-like FMN-dependent dehydrogenase